MPSIADPTATLTHFIQQAASAPACRVRIAPTPSGFLHAGNALNFIFNALCARVHPQGHILLRIDDLDDDRKRPEFVADIFDTLRWLGISWDQGPTDPDDFEQRWSQKYFLADMLPGLEALAAEKQVFACMKSRKACAPFGDIYPDAFRLQGLPLDTPNAAWRADTPPGFPLPCFIVRRRDGMPSYQMASVALDIKFGITHIIRGDDLRTSSAAQYWLAEKAGWQPFKNVRIFHHSLIKDATGQKLSKSAGATSLREMYLRKDPPALFFQHAAKWLGLPEKNIQNLFDLVALFKAHVV